MEENSEAQVETEMSSTKDASGAQEATDSHGNMETVVLIEVLKEEDLNNQSTDETTQVSPRKGAIKSPEKAPSTVHEPQTSSNSKPNDNQKPPQKEASTLRTYTRSPFREVKGQQKIILKSVEPLQESPVQTTDSNTQQLQKTTDPIEDTSSFQTPQVKSVQRNNSIEKSPAKPVESKHTQSTLTSPVKSLEPKEVQSPAKSVELRDTPQQKSPVKPGVKESQQSQNTPPKTLQKPEDVSPHLSSEKGMPQQETSGKSPVKDGSHACTNRTLLDNPLLVNALFGIKENKQESTTVTLEQQPDTTPIVITDSPIEIQSEKSSDISETNSDASEIQNKSISRELRSLINYAKESKIISECTQLTSKTRKSRNALDSSNTSITGTDSDRLVGSSDNSLLSNGMEKSDKTSIKRSMRSQNPEFVNKVKLFLNAVTGKVTKPHSEAVSDEEMEEKTVKDSPESQSLSPKKKKPNDTELTPTKTNKIRSDPYCWRCHWAVVQEPNDKQHAPMLCTVCPRSFHFKCLSGTERSKIISEKNWVCPECLVVLHAESSETRSPAMKRISLGCLCDLLKFALERMMDLNGVEPFMLPVDRVAFPDYKNYVVHPMDLSLMQENIKEGLYGSTEAFIADAQWILHNSIIFNTLQSKLTAVARALVRSCKAEMSEIEACPECYAAAHSRRPTWFTDVCNTPHLLLWAKLKGFPYWPAKCMSISSSGMVDVRFFGAHDRAWVPSRDCFLYSEKDPNNFRTKRQDILDSMQEAEQHIRNISRKYGKFVYPPFKTQLDISKLTEQLKMMIPTFEGEIKSPIKVDKSTPKSVKSNQRSNSKGSKSSSHDGELSDTEETTSKPRKMADGAEIALDEDFSINKDKKMEVDEKPKENDGSRKRRRSEMEEAVITIMDGPTKEKRQCVETKPTIENEPPDNKEDKSDRPAKDETKETDPLQLNEVKMVSTLTPVSEKDLEISKSQGDRSRPPIKMILKTRHFKTSTPKQKQVPQQNPILRLIQLRKDKRKSLEKEKKEEKTPKRRNSKNKSLNSSNQTQKADKNIENTSSSVVELAGNNNDKASEDAPKVIEIPIENSITNVNVTESKVNGNSKEDNNDKPNNEAKAKVVEVTKVTIPVTAKEPAKPKDSSTPKPKEDEKPKNNNSSKSKESQKAKNSNSKSKETEQSKPIDKSSTAKRNSTSSPKIDKEVHILDDDDTSLAMIARENSRKGSLCGLPTITSVRSLSSPQTVETTNKTVASKTVVTNPELSIFTPTSTDSVRNMKEAVSKLNKLRNDTDQSLVGKVGVCAFARMPATPPAEKQANKKSDVTVEIKSEPMDFDDADRQAEKLNLMNAFSLRPVSSIPNVPASALREVRINKVVSAPAVRKGPVKPAETKSRGKKTFQQKKGEDGRSELNGKNSMVYIPIQPPVTQAPVRSVNRTITVNGNPPPLVVSRSNASTPTNTNVTIVSVPPTANVTQATLPPTHTSTTVSSTVTVVSVTSSACLPVQTFPAVVPTTVHTVPLITSVNGQWTFSLQPIMSVGGLDENESTPPLLNGIAERNPTVPPPMLPLTNPCPNVNPVPFPMARPMMPSLVAAADTPSPSILDPARTIPGSPATVVNRPTSEDTVGEPPRLQHKPLMNPFDPNMSVGAVPPPSTAGPITAKLNQNAIKLADFFRTILEDTIEKIDEPASQVTKLKLQLEEARWRHQQEIDELKHNHELLIAEMRSSFEKERGRVVDETRRAAQLDLEAAVRVAKSKQWCANCSQEAQLYCCWNTAYCDYGCQRAHWGHHHTVCTQQRHQENSASSDTDSTSVNSRLQPSSDNLPKTTAAPGLNKGAVGKSSIIVSMVEDKSGNQTVKCVGTYKPNSTPQLTAQPIILNKAVNVINNDEIAAAKKVVTSGGYLIVGAPASNVVTPPRRAQTIQYFS